VPSVTPRPTLTATPGLTPGVVEQDHQLIVTALDHDLNLAVASAFYVQDSRPTTMPPVITLDYGGQVQIEMAFYNSFLNRNSQVVVQARLSAADGQIAVEEQRDQRAVTGGLVSDLWITRALTTLAGPVPGSYRLRSITVYPDHVQAIFVEEAPAG
jgi:hypothetical protein